MNRIKIKYYDATVAVMKLTARILARSGHPIEILESEDGADLRPIEYLRPDWEEAVSLKQQLVEGWKNLSGEEILEQLEYIWTTQEADVPRVDLRQNLDLWLLKALAQEKCLHPDLGEVEESYHHCRHLGRWNYVIVRNNLAVLKARRQECLDSLKLFAEAIQHAITHKVLLRAPFYNAALIFQQLHKSGLIHAPQCVTILDELAAAVGHGTPTAAGGEPTAPTPAPASDTPEPPDRRPAPPSVAEPSESDVRAKYVSLARYGRNIKEPEADANEPEVDASKPSAFFQNHITYLAPSVDLFESFGDFADQVDARNAHKYIEKGNDFADRQMFEQSVENFKMAVLLDPSREFEVSGKLAQLYDEWRYVNNQRMSELLDDHDFDKASSVVWELPDERLKRPDDDRLVAAIRRRQHSRALVDAEAAGEAEARLIYIGLLKEPDLADSVRLVASSRLARRLREVKDDAERHRELKELILHGLHPQVVARLTNEFERRLVKEALAHARLKEHDQAIRKYFWALLLPDRADRREELFKGALFQFAQLPEASRDINSCGAVGDGVFDGLRAELKERWDGDQSATLLSEFNRLDAEPHLSQKRLDELIRLLDSLIGYEQTTERRLARLRLTREKEAQERFQSIETLLRQISVNGNHDARRDAIASEVNALRGLAVDFAASEQHKYAEEINDFVLRTAELLRHADNQKFKHDRTFEVNRRNEDDFRQFRDVLGDGAGPTDILTAICNQLRTARGGKFLDEVTELSLHWLRVEGRAVYLRLSVSEPPRAAAAVINESLSILRRNQSVLPDEFRGDFRRFLEELAAEIEVPEEPAPPREQPPLPSPPVRGFWRRAAEWFRSPFG